MADNDQNPKTKVNPLTAGLGLEGLKGYNTQDQTQEIKKESQVYTITRNDGTQVNRSYDELSADEKRAVASSGVVAGGKTDIEQKYSVVPDSVGVRPTRTVAPGSGLGTITSIVAPVLLGARKGVPGIIAGGVVGTISAITAGANAAKEEQKYQDALREFNQKVSDSAVIAGDWDKDEDGNLIFMPDYSKVGEGINVAESGAKVADLFDLEGGSEPNVFFSDDGVLHVDIDRTFADTEEYKEIINSISSDYAGLTKDTAGVDEYLNGFKQWLSSALNQYRFEVNRVAGYRSQLPNASVEAIMDASRNEIGAMLADADKKDWTVKVYRDGEIVESNAEEVLDHVLNMKDKYERDDYIETLGDMLQDDSISDDNKAYILSEYNLLFSASDADVKEGGADEERKKYSEMLDQDFFVTLFRGSSVIRGLDNLADGIAGHISQGEVDDILIANQNYLEPEEVASNFSAVVGTAFDIYISQKIMQGLENKVVRPVLGAASKSIGKSLISTGSEIAGKVGKKLVESSYSAVTDSAGNVIKYRTALDITNAKNHALNNVIQAFGNETSGLSYRLLAKGGAQVLLWSLGELAINFASDALYDATKLGTAVISGEIDSEDEAYQYMMDALGQDLVMDLVLQYGPQGMLDIHTTSDAIRLQNVEPYARGVAEARTKYGEALNAVDAARASKATKKEISRLESEVTARKNDLTKAEVEYADARKKYVGGSSQKFGAKLAEIESRLSENEMYRKFQEAVVDDNAAGTAMARAAYAASGGDVELFNKLMNSVSNNLRTLTRITANELSSDKWAKGTGDALNAFKQKYSELANYFGKISKADDDYIKAKNELIRYTEAAKGDKKQIAAAEAFYSKWINAVGRDRAVQLDELMDTMRNVINKTNESAINAGIQTEEDIQTKRNATGFQEQGYIPMYLKRKNKNSHYVIPQERNLDHTWDRGEFWDIDNLENPVLNTLTYVNYTARNIAVNERNKAIVAASEIPGMRTHRTDAGNEIIRTEDGHVYKHSDIIGHMEPKIDQRLAKLGKVKKEAPTELEFSDEKDRILYGKVGGTHEELADGFKKIVETAEKQRGDVVILYRGQRSRGNGLSTNEWSERFAGYDQNPVENTSWWSSDQEYPKNIAGEDGQVIKMGIPRADVISADDVAKDVKDAIRYKYGYVTEQDPSNGGEYFVADANKKGLNSFRKSVSGKKAAYYNELISDSVISPSDLNELNRAASGRGVPADGNDFESFVNVRSVLDFYNKPVAEFKDGEYVFNTERNPDYYAEHASAAEAPEDALRADVNNRIDALKKYYNDTYSKFGYTTGVRVSQTKIDAFIERGDFDGLATYLEGLNDRASLARPTDQEISDVVFNKQVAGLEIELKRSMNKNFPGLDNEQKREVYARILGEFRRKAAESGDITAKQVAEETFARNVGYPINYFESGEEKTAYIDGPLAKPVYELCVRSENVTDRNFIQKTFEGAAKLKRYTTTAIDATRALPNLLRDTLRGDIMSGGTDYVGARKIFAEILDAENLTAKQKADAMKSIELAIRVAQGETLNAAVENRTERGLQDMVRETRQEGKNAVSKVIWDVAHLRLGHALETPMNIAEMSTRRRMAQSAYVREFKNAKYTSTSFDERLSKAYDAGINAGLENTTNFSRRGTAVGVMARYVPYFQQNFANIESANNAFLKDPAGVASRAALFSYAYVMMLADTLKKEETRRAYYNLSDYDRKNNIVFSLDGDTLVTIPLDESLSALVTPWRRTVETLNNVDPGTFASIFTDTLLEFMPIDLDGFTEGDGLNVRRGVEKLASQMAPSLATEMMQTITGYNLYYGSDNAVTDESLAQYGQTAQSAGDYTTASANSKLLRKLADATGIPQWQLQQTVANFGGNVGQYVLNTLDKLAGAAKDEQGGKEFINATFKSMTGTDSTNAKNQFYNGISELRKEKAKVVNKLDNLNDQISVSSGAELADLKRQYQNVKDDYAMKVSNFVEQYLNAYEITGGLEKSQANQIYYLFNLYDDDTVYQSGSVGEYYQNLARQEAYNEADAWAAPVLDRYYDQTQNVYKDASGVWHYYSPYGEQSYYNTLYGQGMKHQVGLRNLIEGVTSGLKSARSEAYEARSAAMENKDYDLYDQIGADFDAQVVELITPYIKEYGADNVLGNSSVLDYLEEWFFVPSSYMKTNKNRYVPSLAHNASKQRAFVRSYIKSLYGVDTGYTPTERKSLLNPEVF